MCNGENVAKDMLGHNDFKRSVRYKVKMYLHKRIDLEK